MLTTAGQLVIVCPSVQDRCGTSHIRDSSWCTESGQDLSALSLLEWLIFCLTALFPVVDPGYHDRDGNNAELHLELDGSVLTDETRGGILC